MKKYKQHLKWLKQEVANHSLYLWAGQGESCLLMSPQAIIKQETGNTNAGRVLATLASRVKAGLISEGSKYFDCSGLQVYYLMKAGLLKYDINADTMMKKHCKNVRSISEVKDYDFVFVVNVEGKAEHVGFYYQGNVYESRGRDYGVGVWPLSERKSFNYCGTWPWY